MVADGLDLSTLDVSFPVTLGNLASLTDHELLQVYDSIIGFSG